MWPDSLPGESDETPSTAAGFASDVVRGATARRPGCPARWGLDVFCPFPLPAESGTQRFINLGIVQYIDVRADEVKIAFGGGNFGSGHEARIPVQSRDEADAVLARLRQTAARCAQSTPGVKP